MPSRRNRSRAAPAEGSHNSERWLISYADFITLLFAFFVVMYAISTVNSGKYRVMADSFVDAFNDPDKRMTPVQVGVFEGKPKSAEVVNVVDVHEGGAAGELDTADERGAEAAGDLQTRGEIEQLTLQAEPEQQQLAIEEGDLIEQIAKNINEKMKPLIEKDAITVSQSDDFIEIEINNNVLFPSGSARLHNDAIPILTDFSNLFKTFNNAIQVEGFTDNEPISTTAFPSNWELSAARAASVVHLFMKSGLAPERMVAVGYGEFRPVASNATEAGREQNRRVVIVIPAIDQGQHIKDAGARDIRRGATGQRRISSGATQ